MYCSENSGSTGLRQSPFLMIKVGFNTAMTIIAVDLSHPTYSFLDFRDYFSPLHVRGTRLTRALDKRSPDYLKLFQRSNKMIIKGFS